MKMLISNSSQIPIYEQIKKSIIKQIINNELHEDDAIPSIRALARDIRISVMTVKKAYDELEKDGYIVSIQGKGTFVAHINGDLAIDEAQKDIENHITEIVNISKKFSIEKEKVIDTFNLFYGSDN